MAWGRSPFGTSSRESHWASRCHTLPGLWALPSGQLVHARDTKADPFTALQFSNDGRLLAIATQSGATEVWDVSSWNVQQKFAASSAIYTLAISPDNRLLAGETDYDIQIWSLPTQKRLAVLHAPFDCYCLNSLAFSPDSATLASADGDTAISQLATWRCPRCGANMCIGPNLTAQQLAFRCKLPDTS